MSILAVQFLRGSEEAATEFTYTEFRAQLRADNIHEVKVIEGRAIEGQLRAPVVREGGETVEFKTMLPGDIDEALLSEMEEK
ncbi:MAG: hypothetical protein GWN79_20460, partial [Actinobacteria bacterium]|nr:hypothetical protein [Actinomycetota bacterium]NIY07196.1 hypothetical protein [Gemmatimonadota bacterium]